MKDFFQPEDFESPDLLDFFQFYRHTPMNNQEKVSRAYEILKSEIAHVANAKIAPLLQANALMRETLEKIISSGPHIEYWRNKDESLAGNTLKKVKEIMGEK